MVIQLPEWNGWRVSGSGTDWQIQVLRKRTTREDTWEGTNFYSSLANALEAAYEKMLRESGEKVDDLRKTLGYDVIQFAEDVLEIKLHQWQKWLFIHALECWRAKEEIAKAAGK